MKPFKRLFFYVVFLFVIGIISPSYAYAQTGASSGGTGDILVENWTESFIYNTKRQPSRLYDLSDVVPAGEMRLWDRSLSIHSCFTQSILTGPCQPLSSTNKELKNNTGVGIDIIDHEGRKVNRYWLQQNTGSSHGARLQVPYTFLANYANRRIYARYYMKFPQQLPVSSGGSWMSVGVEMKAHGCCVPATIQHNYDRNHQGWMASAYSNVVVSHTRPQFVANKWYKMDVIWDMTYPTGKWEAFIDGVKWGEGVGQVAQSNGYGLWIFNLYGDILHNQVRGEMYIGDVIMSTQPIDNTTPAPTMTSTPLPTPTVTPVDNGNNSKLTSTSVSASSSQAGNGPENTVDGNLNTRWSACGVGEWLKYDLGTVKTVSHTNIAFYLANTQIAKFDIEVSSDNVNWTKVFSGQSNTNTLGLQKFDFADISGRYVRIIGNGNLTTDAACWNSFTEVEHYGTSNAAKTADANNDNIIDGKDYVIWLNNYNKSTSAGISMGDFNADGLVDGKDYVLWLNNYNK